MSELTCRHCGMTIYDEDALLCHQCGGSLGRSSGDMLGKMRGAGHSMLWITIAIIVAFSLLTVFLF